MKIGKEVISNEVIVFKDICRKMYSSSNLVERDSKRKIIYNENYAKVVCMLLDSEASKPINGVLSIAEVGFIFDISKERTRQVISNAIGSSDTARCKALKLLGARKALKIKKETLGRTTDREMTDKRNKLKVRN